MSWQTFLVYFEGHYIGSFQALSKEEAIAFYSKSYPKDKLEVL
jgi:hypothetical protein